MGGGRAVMRYMVGSPWLRALSRNSHMVLFLFAHTALAGNEIAAQAAAARAEVNAYVAGIRNAEAKYDAEFDGYLAVGSGSRAYGELSTTPHVWVGGEQWSLLGWAPDKALRSAYWVTIGMNEAGAQGYVVHGIIDANGDGCAYEVVATSAVVSMVIPGTAACW